MPGFFSSWYVDPPKVNERLTHLFTETDNCTQSTTEIVVPYSTIDDRPHCTTMYMYLRGGSRSFHNGVVLFQKPFFLRNNKRYRHVIQSENYKTWKKEKWQGRHWKCSVKFNIVLPIYNLGEYSGQVMNKSKINMMSRNETKRNIAYVDDLILS